MQGNCKTAGIAVRFLSATMSLITGLVISTASLAGEKFFDVVAISVADETAVLTGVSPDQQFTVVELGKVIPTTSFVLTAILPDRLVLQSQDNASIAPGETTSTNTIWVFVAESGESSQVVPLHARNLDLDTAPVPVTLQKLE